MKKQFVVISKSALLFVLIQTFGYLVYAQSTIRFSVNVEYADYQPGDRVVVSGSTAELGSWDLKEAVSLQSSTAGNKLFSGSVTLTSTSPGETIHYKFVLVKADGREIWEDRVNRSLVANQSEMVLEEVFFSDRPYTGLTAIFTELTFTLDASELLLNGEAPQGIAVLGNRGNLGFDLEQDRLEMQELGNGLWSATAMLPYGSWPDIEFKFAWQVDGEWQWEYIPGHANHAAWLQADASKQAINMIFVPETGKILPAGGQAHVDNFVLLQEQLGDLYWNSNYAYSQAMGELTEGSKEQALATYNRYKANKTDDSGIDDFYYRYAATLHTEQGIKAAIAFIEGRQAEAGISEERKAYYEYLKGERYVHEGDGKKARKHFKKTIAGYNEEQLAYAYSRHGLMLSYLADSDRDSVQHGVQIAQERLYVDTTQTHALLRYMAHAYQRMGNKAGLEQALWQMTQTGTVTQRSEAALQLARKQARERRFEEALFTISRIDTNRVSPKITEDKEFLEVQLLEEKGDRHKANRLKEKLKRKYKGNARLQKFESKGRQEQ